MKLSIIIPVYNEEKTVKKVIDKIKYLKLTVKKELVVVDDGSADKSYEKIKNIKGIKILRHKKNKGKGAAIKTALKHVTGDIIIIQDADLELNPKEYPKLIRPLLKNEAKVVYGSRFLGKYYGEKNISYFANRFLTLVTNILFMAKITDMETCYKVMGVDIIKKINLKSKRFDVEPEITAKILKRNIKIKELPITYNSRSVKEGKKINWKDGIKAIWTLIKYRFID